MEMRFREIGELTTSLQTYMNNFSPYDSCDAAWLFEAHGLEGHFVTRTLAPGFSVSFVDASLDTVFRFKTKSSQTGLVKIGINLEGIMESKIKGYRHEICGFPGQSYISRVDGEMEMESLISPQKRIRLLEIHFGRDLFRSLCDDSECSLTSYLKSVAGENGNAFTYCSTVLPPAQEETALDIINALSRPEKEAAEALCREFAQRTIIHVGRGMQSASTVISASDIEKIRQSRALLEENLITPPSLKEMAVIIGLNDYKLKAGYRQAYGSTYHRTLTELRLEKARRILLKKDRSVSETAMEVGYGNLGDFGIAFKKRFGMTPRMMLVNALPSEITQVVDTFTD